MSKIRVGTMQTETRPRKVREALAMDVYGKVIDYERTRIESGGGNVKMPRLVSKAALGTQRLGNTCTCNTHGSGWAVFKIL